MNKKKVNYILIPVVLLIWGYIAYIIINGFSKEEKTFTINNRLSPIEIDSVKSDSFVLQANYIDPFLKNKTYQTSRSSSKIISKPKINTPKKEVIKPSVNWNFIHYHGRIKNQKTGKHVAMMNISGKDYLINEGESKDDVKLIKLLEDSIKISYQKEYAFIKKD